jgi:ferredoxin-NADP reductase
MSIRCCRFSILRVRRDIRDTFTLELAPSNGVARRAAAPGQFNTLIP